MEHNNKALLLQLSFRSARHRLVRGDTILRRGGKFNNKQQKMGGSYHNKQLNPNLYVVDGAVTDIVRCMYTMPLLLGRSRSRNLSSGAWTLASRLLNRRGSPAPPECSPSSTTPRSRRTSLKLLSESSHALDDQ